jgi:hypothetical protein
MSDCAADAFFIPAGRRLLRSNELLRPSGRRGERDPVAGRIVGTSIPCEARPDPGEDVHVEAEVEPHPWRRWTGPAR